MKKLYQAYRACLSGKKNTINALEFELDREKNLVRLLEDLKSRRYVISRHICFVVTSPTPREIFAADFRDRIVHHLLCNEIQAMFESDFIEHSYANRIGKGTHKAVNQLRRNLQQTRRPYPQGAYYLKLDIANFFRSIDRAILFSLVKDTIARMTVSGEWSQTEKWREEILWLVEKIIFNDPTKNYLWRGDKTKIKLIPNHKSLFYAVAGKGLPIGNLTSQFFANVYLNELDHFITDKLKVKKYVRYVDDFVLVDERKESLLALIPQINSFLKSRLELNLHPKKIQLQEIAKGIDFLGYIVRPNYTLVRQKVVKRLKKLIYDFEINLIPAGTLFFNAEENQKESEKFLQVVQSYFGHFSHAQSLRLQTAIGRRVLLAVFCRFGIIPAQTQGGLE